MMNDEIREQLSALADDELNEMERPLLFSRLERDSALRACLGRYQLIGEVMRGGIAETATLGVADRVQEALQQDSTVSVPGQLDRGGGRWLKPVAGLAVAASVALVAVLAVTSVQETATESTPPLASTGTAAETGRVVAAPGEQWNRIEPGVDKRLSGYLVNHNEYAASRGVQGVMPYVRIVGFENNR